MPIPGNLPGATFPADTTLASAQSFIASNYDVAVPSSGAYLLVYPISGQVNAMINNLPFAWNYIGPMVTTPKLIAELVNSGVRFSGNGFATLLSQIQVTMAKQALSAASPAATQTALQGVIASFFNAPTP